jgi:hypothetical protein
MFDEACEKGINYKNSKTIKGAQACINSMIIFLSPAE